MSKNPALSTRPTVIGIFLDRAQAERAVEELRSSGFRQDQIGVIVRDEEPPTGLTIEGDVRAEKGAATGALAGGILGSLLGGCQWASQAVLDTMGCDKDALVTNQCHAPSKEARK